jgi:hypothetical protein
MWVRSVLADTSPSPNMKLTHHRRIYNDSTVLTNGHGSPAGLHSGNEKPSRRYPHKLIGALPLALAPIGKHSKGSETKRKRGKGKGPKTRASRPLHLPALWCILCQTPYAQYWLNRWGPLRRTVRHCSERRQSPPHQKLRNANSAPPRCTASARTTKMAIPHSARLSLWKKPTRLNFCTANH